MAITFIPNDPLALAFVPTRQVSPRPDRAASQAGFTFFDEAEEGTFPLGTAEFLFWQCREAALLSIEVWEALNGPLPDWSAEAFDAKRLQLIQDGGDRLNAFYDRQSLAFFHHATGGHTTFSGASTDVVAHEAGHAFLDVIRPALFSSNMTEEGAFHEAFGDCIAMLVALFDQETRVALLAQSPDLGTPNFVEMTTEDLSDGIRRAFGPTHPAAAPRQALNVFKFQLPTTLPTVGPPSVLTSEIHSFGRIFSGCFYDLIRNLFVASAVRDGASLLAAARTAGTLLIKAAREAPPSARFFQSVGRSMVLADDATNGGQNRQAIGRAFAQHGVFLGSSSALMPKVALAGEAATVPTRGETARLARSTLRDIRRRIEASPAARIAVAPITLGTERFLEAIHYREVELGRLGKDLKGVIALAAEPVVVGASGGSPAVFNTLPDPMTTSDEVLRFVETLVVQDRIQFTKGRTSRTPRGASLASPRGIVGEIETGQSLPSHTIRVRGNRKVLTRLRFFCGRQHRAAAYTPEKRRRRSCLVPSGLTTIS